MEFVALDKRKALRLALDYWYRNLSNDLKLAEFIKCCAWKKEGIEYIVVYNFQAIQGLKWQ